MSNSEAGDYLPGDPRYGLSGEALKDYYRTKPAQWAIYCWDKPGRRDTRRALLAETRRATSKVSASASSATAISFPTTAATRWARRSSCSSTTARRRTSSSPTSRMNKAGVYERVEIHRWSNSFQKRAADYRRKGMQQFLCTGPKTGAPEFFRKHLHAHESYFASYGDSFIFRGPIRSADGADNIGTALLLELPDRAAADKFWNEEPFPRTADMRGTRDCTVGVWGSSVPCPATHVSARPASAAVRRRTGSPDPGPGYGM